MSNNVAISVRGLSKAYTIAHNDEKHSTLAETLLHRIRQPLVKPQTETFWALRDISFDVMRGDVVGVIGRNGAGKSTLLKILSQITEPTSGEIDLYGRIASLLEVGTGFHPELTGRENIYLNGAILGMRNSEITSQFDAIVEFSGVDRFLDTPVKRYSSGMYVRLAFAVAAHLNPEILIVDEVLAVGDTEFQKKCLGKMKDVASGGRTVLFVSHNMDFISKLCSKAVLLNAGRVEVVGDVEQVTREYISHAGKLSNEYTAASETRALRWMALDRDALMQDRLSVKIGYRFSDKVVNPTFGIVIYTDGGNPIFGSNTLYHPPAVRPANGQEGEAAVTFDALPLWSGRYTISVWLSDGWSPIDQQESAVVFDFVSSRTPLNAPSPKSVGSIHLPASWTLNKS